MPKALFLLLLTYLILGTTALHAQTANPSPPAAGLAPGGVQITGQLFLALENVSNDKINAAHFVVNRAYLNFRKNVTESISIRVTPDVTVDQDGDGEGDVELRLKYAYIKLELPEIPVFGAPDIEFGLAPRSMLNFEQTINRYRVRGPMFLERAGALSTADFGVGVNALIGGKMDKQYRDEVNSKYAGRYGSISVGIYNGGGYHALENNINKSLEGRLSIRPVPDIVPGLQFTYSGVSGKGNTALSPDFSMHTGMASFEARMLRVTGQYYTGTGNMKGNAYNTDGTVADYTGMAAFADLKIPAIPVYIFGEYDQLTRMATDGDIRANTMIAGLSWYWHGQSKLVFDYGVESLEYDDAVAPETLPGNDVRYKLSVEVNF